MTTQITSSALKSIFTSIILLFVLMTGTVNAAGTNTANSNPFELKYVGKLNNQPVFKLNVDNPKKEEVYITLLDEVGNILYSDKFNEKKFSKKFQFDLSDGNETKIKMTLLSKNVRKWQVFKINNVENHVENVSVSKLN